jgi:hypothetical protein
MAHYDQMSRNEQRQSSVPEPQERIMPSPPSSQYTVIVLFTDFLSDEPFQAEFIFASSQIPSL